MYLYTCLIDGLVSSRLYIDAIRLYCGMVSDSVVPDNYVITSVLKACAAALALREGREIHGQVLKLGLRSDRSIRLKLVEFYGKCGEFGDAVQVFEEMPECDVVASTVMMNCCFDNGLVERGFDVFNRVEGKDTVCWTAMIDGLVRNGEMSRALDVFREMQRESVRPNEVTIVCVLSSCSQLGALELGRWVHSYVGKHGIELNHFVGGALINMYSRCGDIDEAVQVFEEMKERNVISYNLVIAGLAMHGRSFEAIEMFYELLERGLEPSSVTFVGVLNACSHGGQLDLGFKIFHSMRNFGVKPQVEHYGCMVDLLGRVGRPEEAYNFIMDMNVEPDHIMLGAILSACRIHGNHELGEKIAKMLLDCGKADSGTYTLLSNVYARSGRWEDAAQMRAKMRDAGIEKEPGCSSIEVNNEIHEFILGDIRHPQREQIYTKLQELNQILRSTQGYSPATETVLHDIEEKDKEWALAIHSERLAICYGLISTKPFTTIRVAKNLRVCNDCHSTIKLIAKITKRKIIVRDRNRFHHFEDGVCSCGDYW